MSAVVEASREDFAELTASGDVLVDVWGRQCRPCLALMPTVEQLAEQRQALRVVKLEAQRARRICIELKVMGLPAFVFLRDGTEVGRLTGDTITADSLTAWVDEQLAAGSGAAAAG